MENSQATTFKVVLAKREVLYGLDRCLAGRCIRPFSFPLAPLGGETCPVQYSTVGSKTELPSKVATADISKFELYLSASQSAERHKIWHGMALQCKPHSYQILF